MFQGPYEKRHGERILELKNAGSASPSDNHVIKVRKSEAMIPVEVHRRSTDWSYSAESWIDEECVKNVVSVSLLVLEQGVWACWHLRDHVS